MSVTALLAAWDAGDPVSLPWIDAGPSEAQGVYIFALELLRFGRSQTAPIDRIELKVLNLLAERCPLTPQQISQGRTVARWVLSGKHMQPNSLVSVQRTFPTPPPPPRVEAAASPALGTDFPRRRSVLGRGPGADLAKAQSPAGGYIGEALQE